MCGGSGRMEHAAPGVVAPARDAHARLPQGALDLPRRRRPRGSRLAVAAFFKRNGAPSSHIDGAEPPALDRTRAWTAVHVGLSTKRGAVRRAGGGTLVAIFGFS